MLEFNINKVNEESFTGNWKVSTAHAVPFAALQTFFPGFLLILRQTSHKRVGFLSPFLSCFVLPASTHEAAGLSPLYPVVHSPAADINFLFIEKSIRFELSKDVCTSGKDTKSMLKYCLI